MKLAVFLFCGLLQACQPAAKYFPPAGEWKQKPPAELGLDAAKLAEAVEFAKTRDGGWDFGKDQVRVFGRPLGPVPTKRATTNGVIVRHGYIAATFGDTKANDPIYSAAKSFLSTVCGLAADRGLIKNVDDPVHKYIQDGSYDSAHNRKVTWRHHLHQTSEWEGTMFGKKSDFVGREEFGSGERKPREIEEPGSFYEYNDVRINRFSLSLMKLFGKGLPEVLKTEIMDPIGGSNQWRWIPYDNSNGSVSGGTRWGGGIWMNSEDMARFGLLILNKGNWNGRQILSKQWLKQAVVPGPHGPDYGYLWWLNTQGKHTPSTPVTTFAAMGNGSNTIWIDPEHDMVVVWRWFEGAAMDGFLKRVLAAVAR